MFSRRHCLALLALLLLGTNSCASSRTATPPATVAFVDLARYSGTWYELARLPMWFQRDCLQSKAEYTLLPGKGMDVVNSCPAKEGGHKEAHGIATVVDEQTNAKLTVLFDNWFSRLFPWLTRGDYWILALDPEYQTAVVGTPDREFLWILARQPAIEATKFEKLVDRAQTLGFGTERLLIFNNQPMPDASGHTGATP